MNRFWIFPCIATVLLFCTFPAFAEREVGGLGHLMSVRLEFAPGTQGIDSKTHAALRQFFGGELAAGRLAGYRVRSWNIRATDMDPHLGYQGANCPQGYGSCDAAASCNNLIFCRAGSVGHQGLSCPPGYGTCGAIADSCKDLRHLDCSEGFNACATVSDFRLFDTFYEKIKQIIDAGNNHTSGPFLTRYVSDVICDDAALDRFPSTLEQ